MHTVQSTFSTTRKLALALAASKITTHSKLNKSDLRLKRHHIEDGYAIILLLILYSFRFRHRASRQEILIKLHTHDLYIR